MRCVLMVALALAGCGAQLGDPPTMNPAPGKGDGPGSGGGDGSGSGGGGSGSGGPTAITATQYCTGLADLDCHEAWQCMSQFPTDLGYSFSDGYGSSEQVCDALFLEDFAPATIEAEIVQGRLAFDGASAAGCLQTITFASCSDFFHNGPVWGEPCYHMFTPEVMQGGACAIDASCTTGYCEPQSGTCQPHP